MKRVAIFLFLALFATGVASATSISQATFKDLEGKTHRLGDFKGKVVLVNFFASYCPPCMVEIKELVKLYRKYQKDGLVVVGLMVDREGESLLPHIVEAKGITYPVGLATKEILDLFGNPPITPTTFIIDREGTVVKRLIGYTGRKYLEKKVKEYLFSKGL